MRIAVGIAIGDGCAERFARRKVAPLEAKKMLPLKLTPDAKSTEKLVTPTVMSLNSMIPLMPILPDWPVRVLLLSPGL